jgi:hypothetical protein
MILLELRTHTAIKDTAIMVVIFAIVNNSILSRFIRKASITATRDEVNSSARSVECIYNLFSDTFDIISYPYSYTQKQIVLTNIFPYKD